MFYRKISAVCRCACLLAALVATAAEPSRAQTLDEFILYESATPGTTEQTVGGLVINTGLPFGNAPSWLGARFELDQPAIATRIGGHLYRIPSDFNSVDANTNRLIFGALLKLDHINDLPTIAMDGQDIPVLDQSEILAVSLFEPPFPSSEGSVEIDPVLLAPGAYAIMFGSGLFGAEGGAAMALGNNLTATPSMFGFLGRDVIPLASQDMQFLLIGIPLVPEPMTGLVLCLGMACLLNAQWRQAAYRRRNSA